MRSKLLFSLLLATLAFSTTASADPHRGHDRGRDRDRVWSHRDPRPHFTVRHRPPQMRYDRMGHRPSYHHVWISGYWRWSDGYSDWVWVNGYWTVPPSRSVIYIAPSYRDTPDGVVYVDGGWCEPSYARSDNAATGTVIGGVLGGVIGHQSHKTGLGVVLGAVVGGLIGNDADERQAERRYEAAQSRAAQTQAAQAQANANAQLEKEKLIAQGQTISEQELAAAQERARIAKEKLAQAKAEQQADFGRAAALEKANAEAAAAEAELQALKK